MQSACTAGKCTESTCSVAKCTDGTCTEGKCTATKCTDGKCCGTCDGDKTKCTEGECTDAKCCGTCDGDKTKCTEGTCADGKCTEGECAEGMCTGTCENHKTDDSCPITVAMKKLPKTLYVVGETKTDCHCSASELAEKSGTKMIYVVAGQAFECPTQAKKALADATEKYVAAFAEPQTCQETGTCSIAGRKSCCPTMAAATSKQLKTAMAKVKMAFVVGDKKCGCPVAAKQLAKDSGEATQYIVAGQKTPCEVTARLNLARAKYRAAIEILVKAEAQAQTSEDS
jgi:adenosyl cobinamide kinase/adenosyl cobinamide phosphate guanylyltransferase